MLIQTHRYSTWAALFCIAALILGVVLSIALPVSAQTPTLTTLHAFVPSAAGANPNAGLIQGSDGAFYGTASGGGAYGWGTVFKITASGEETVLYSFHGGADGATPYAGLIQGKDGDFYGTTEFGGTGNRGTVFKITPAGAETVLYTFSSNPDGSLPYAGLVQGADGNFYGTTYYGGAQNDGIVFKLTPSGAETVLHSFSGSPSDGGGPYAGLVQGTDSNFYGTTAGGGANNAGTIFKITSAGAEAVLYSFTGGNDGFSPAVALIQGKDGAFYGTTTQGGTNEAGTVFKITSAGSLTTLYAFTGGSDGSGPNAGLLQGTDGNFYGTTYAGGVSDNGTIFKITPTGAETTLYVFPGPPSDGSAPLGGLVQGADGAFYGTTSYGGANNRGIVFKVTPTGAETVLSSFPATDGARPFGGLAQGTDGNFYGTTSYGGEFDFGAVFKMTASGADTVLHSFNVVDGFLPEDALVQGTDGAFYGTAYQGGAYDGGTLFKITSSGVETVLHSFSNGADGALVPAGLIQGTDGNFYGTTNAGGAYNYGTVFKITSAGVETVLHSFSGPPSDGIYPFCNLVQGTDGNFYGTTAGGGAYGPGTVFKITPTGTETMLYSFHGGVADGYGPNAGLILGTDGNFYGTTPGGGAYSYGTIFKVTPSGSESVLCAFRGGAGGGGPYAGLVQGADGNFYGAGVDGGAYFRGTLFQVTPAGALTTLYSFTGGTDGYGVFTALIQGADGLLYGTNNAGGANAGTVFRLSGVYPAPALAGHSPGSVDAGGPAFTLTLKGTSFQPFSSAHWNGMPLATTYVSATQLKAAVPASLIASPGKATMTIVTGAGGGTSGKKTFTILLTTLKLTAASLSKNGDGSYTATITLKNIGYKTAPSVEVTKATLGAAATSSPLPMSIGSTAAGASGTATLIFPNSAGTSGATVTLKVSGAFTGGKFAGALKVKLP